MFLRNFRLKIILISPAQKTKTHEEVRGIGLKKLFGTGFAGGMVTYGGIVTGIGTGLFVSSFAYWFESWFGQLAEKDVAASREKGLGTDIELEPRSMEDDTPLFF